MKALAHELAALSANEMLNALGVRGGPALLRQGLSLPFFLASRGLGQTLAELDGAVTAQGLPAAAAQSLQRLGISLRVSGAPVGDGPRLLLANHPGAYDALALMSAIGRNDLLILAADRGFLRALPRLSQHLLFVGERPGERAGALKRAVSSLRGGGAVLHFPAGDIEPDADYEPDASRLLKAWQPGVAALLDACASADGRVVTAGVRGVHSPRVKRMLLNRLAERRGLTTLAPLLQMLGKLRDVVTRVRLADPESACELCELGPEARTARLRASLLRAISAA
jgi:hypothetical protein